MLEQVVKDEIVTDERPIANILLVDDRSENLLAMEALLAPLGQNVVLASSAREALKALLKMEFALILLDVQMPGMDGFELAALIKERERTRNIPIIMVTALHNSADNVERGYKVGAVDYLFKPFSPEILQAKVGVFVALHQTTHMLRDAERREYERQLVRIKEEVTQQQQTVRLNQILRELEYARDIQRSILPARFQANGSEVFAYIQAAREVGGDFYDVTTHYTDGPAMTCLIGDVSGKGMPAALTMVLALTVMREVSRLHLPLSEWFSDANRRLCPQLHASNVANNVSAAALTLNLHTRSVQYCKAGHEDLLWYSARRRAVEVVTAQGLLLGVSEQGWFEERTLQAEEGDKLILYTDGITEARNVAGEWFGLAALVELIEQHGSESANGLGQAIIRQVADFQSGREPADDIGLIVIAVK